MRTTLPGYLEYEPSSGFLLPAVTGLILPVVPDELRFMAKTELYTYKMRTWGINDSMNTTLIKSTKNSHNIIWLNENLHYILLRCVTKNFPIRLKRMSKQICLPLNRNQCLKHNLEPLAHDNYTTDPCSINNEEGKCSTVKERLRRRWWNQKCKQFKCVRENIKYKTDQYTKSQNWKKQLKSIDSWECQWSKMMVCY